MTQPPTEPATARRRTPCLLRSAAAFAAAAACWAGSGCGPASSVPWENGDRPAGDTNLGPGNGVRSAEGRKPGLLGYSASPLYRRDVRTVAIEMFDSREYRRQWEFKVTEAISKRMQLETGWRLAHPSKADTLLTGELLVVGASVLSEQPDTGGVIEYQPSVAVRWRWKDLRTGRILYERTDSNPDVGYAFSYPILNEGFNFGVDAAVDNVARRVVAGMRNDF